MRANGDKTNVGNSGVGSPSHVGGILFQQAVGAPLTMVPYRGAGDSTTALLAGQIDVMLNTPALSVSQRSHASTPAKLAAVIPPSAAALGTTWPSSSYQGEDRDDQEGGEVLARAVSAAARPGPR